MNGQTTLEGDTVPVQITEKVTTTVVYKADYFKASLSDEKIDKVKEYAVTGEEGKADEIIVKLLKAHRRIPDNVLGRAFRTDFGRIKAAITEQPVVEKIETEDEEQLMLPGHEIRELMSPEKAQEQVGKDDADIKALLEDLLTREDIIEDYLVNNFKEDVIRKLAEKLHIPIEEDELPQTTALNISIAVQEYKNKAGSR